MRYIFSILVDVSPILVVSMIFNYVMKKKEKRAQQREKERREGIVRTKYIVKTETLLLCYMVVGVIFFGGLLIFCIVENEELWCTVFFLCFFLLGLSGTVNMAVWKIEVDGEEIKWRSTFGRVRKFRFSDITKCVIKKSNAIRVYVNDKRLFTIDSNIDCGQFMEDIEKRGIPVLMKGIDDC